MDNSSFFPARIHSSRFLYSASLMGQWSGIRLPVKGLLVQCLGQEDPLEKEMATHSSILAWEIPWTEESGGL